MPVPLNPAILDPEHTGPSFVAAPWTDDQVANLNWHQTARLFHPFTCGRREHHPDNEGVLVAERDGWVCPADGCGYRQGWALPHMTKPPSPDALVWRDRMERGVRALAVRARPCLHHQDIHPNHGLKCFHAFAQWLDHQPLVGQAARDAYALEVEQRILDQLVRQHAPAHRINPALSK
jgi:hypothetical protein